MPIYEFQCQACGVEVEVLQKISDPHLTDCESCGKSEMKKKVTAAAFRLSGAGWYETDFKEGDKKKNLTETKTENKDQKAGNDSKTKDASNDSSKASKDSSTKGADKSSSKSETSSPAKKKDKPSTDK